MRIVAIVIAAALAASPALAEIDFPRLTGRVVDTSNVIPDVQEAVLARELADFERRTRHQMVVVTVPDLKGVPKEQYANLLGRHWGIGRKGGDDGILLLQSSGDGRPGSGRLYIAAGDGLQDVITDVEGERLARQVMLPILRQDRPRSETVPDAIMAGARATMAFASMTREERGMIERREAAMRRSDHLRRMAAFWDAMLTLLGLGAAAGAGYGAWRFATRKERAARKAEALVQARIDSAAATKRAAEAAERRAEQRRIARAEADRLVAEENRRRAEAARRRQDMLDAMSPEAREAFLAEERRKADEDRRRREDQDRRDREKAERRREEQEQQELQARLDEESTRSAAAAAAASAASQPSAAEQPAPDVFTPGGGSFSGGGGGVDY